MKAVPLHDVLDESHALKAGGHTVPHGGAPFLKIMAEGGSQV